jgi:hypothetical protein
MKNIFASCLSPSALNKKGADKCVSHHPMVSFLATPVYRFAVTAALLKNILTQVACSWQGILEDFNQKFIWKEVRL